jgi:hypothetical protein
VPIPRSVWNAVPRGTAFGLVDGFALSVPMLHRCPAYRKAPVRAGRSPYASRSWHPGNADAVPLVLSGKYGAGVKRRLVSPMRTGASCPHR